MPREHCLQALAAVLQGTGQAVAEAHRRPRGSGLDETSLVQCLLPEQDDRQRQNRVGAMADEILGRFGRLRGWAAAFAAKAPRCCSVDPGGPMVIRSLGRGPVLSGLVRGSSGLHGH